MKFKFYVISDKSKHEKEKKKSGTPEKNLVP
jgi:hypothetical protein